MGEGGEEDAERGKSSVERGDMKAEPHKYVSQLCPHKIKECKHLLYLSM